MENKRFDRQLLLFGDEGQKKIETNKVGIVGLGGIGSQVVQSLTYLGVSSFVLVDDDPVEESNLNRLIGATAEDEHQTSRKTKVAERLVLSVRPDAFVETHPVNLRTKEAIDSLKTCTVIFGCVDNDAARLVLSELAAAYSITLIDSATEIIPNVTPLGFGGRVIVARPGDICLSCAKAIDMDIAKQELESPEARTVRRAHGYGVGDRVTAPAVVSLNGVIANLAVTEFMMLVTGLREPNTFLHYRGERGLKDGNVLIKHIVIPDLDCFTCHYLVGKRDLANIYRYQLEN